MNRRRLLAALSAPAALGLALGATQVAHAQVGSTLDEVKKRGTLRAGVRTEVPGFGIVDEAGKIVGFDIDIATEVAARLGAKVELVPVTAATRVPLLQQGRIDLIAATLTHYRARDQVIDFSIGYFWTGQKLMVKKTSSIKSLADMAGKRAGTTVGAGVVENLKKVQPKATTQTFEGYPEAFLAMQRGLVDAVVADVIILAGLRANSPSPSDYVIVGESVGGGDYGIGLRENDSKWRDAVNFALQDIWRDGSWDKIYGRWIGPGTKLNLEKSEINFSMILWD
ncbi:transporter substrate-binding domain-containing protein [uncultured Enterovirga sp.]|uniref:transporter substrate-binding domain-containing protein n=1 Tax=uncultured Enterovirga sp. TaxID=2026352 RepID=UPI0035C9853C